MAYDIIPIELGSGIPCVLCIYIYLDKPFIYVYQKTRVLVTAPEFVMF